MSNSPVTVVILSKYREVIEPFLKSLLKYESVEFPLVVVTDGASQTMVEGSPTFIQDSDIGGRPVTVTPGRNPFQMAGNGNLGLQAVPSDHDILYCGDDVRFLEDNTIERLQAIAYSDDSIGILCPKLQGRGSPAQVTPPAPEEGKQFARIKPYEMWFPCVYIKRALINKIGLLDERFNDFGSDDVDFCIRAEIADYILAVAPNVTVQHEYIPVTVGKDHHVEMGPTTFARSIGPDAWKKQEREASIKLQEKYNVGPIALHHCLVTGNSKKLASLRSATELAGASSLEDDKEAAMAFLKTRSIFLATPAYGGWLAVNYIKSLMALQDICRDAGITLKISFVYNESLITRARNKLVFEYLDKTDCTDFFFIDADIGFHPWDLLSLVLYDKDIIGVPCVRKNLRLDRIVNLARSTDRELTIEELERITGEFVVNFAATEAPTNINLGRLIEVQDVGTAFLKVRREAFEKFSQHYDARNDNRWYIPMGGEGYTSPTYMYFQSRLDTESAQFTPGGYSAYVSEDYAFCRDAVKAGMKIFMAPWPVTSHFGSYNFQGSLVDVARAGGKLR